MGTLETHMQPDRYVEYGQISSQILPPKRHCFASKWVSSRSSGGGEIRFARARAPQAHKAEGGGDDGKRWMVQRWLGTEKEGPRIWQKM